MHKISKCQRMSLARKQCSQKKFLFRHTSLNRRKFGQKILHGCSHLDCLSFLFQFGNSFFKTKFCKKKKAMWILGVITRQVLRITRVHTCPCTTTSFLSSEVHKIFIVQYVELGLHCILLVVRGFKILAPCLGDMLPTRDQFIFETKGFKIADCRISVFGAQRKRGDPYLADAKESPRSVTCRYSTDKIGQALDTMCT